MKSRRGTLHMEDEDDLYHRHVVERSSATDEQTGCIPVCHSKQLGSSFFMLYFMVDVRPGVWKRCTVKEFLPSAIARILYFLSWSRRNSYNSKQCRAVLTIEFSEVPFKCERADGTAEILASTNKLLFRDLNPVQIMLQTTKNLSQIRHISWTSSWTFPRFSSSASVHLSWFSYLNQANARTFRTD